MTMRPFIRPATVLALASALLGGCAETHRGFEAITHVVSSTSSVDADETGAISRVRTDVEPVRPRGAPRAPANDDRESEPANALGLVTSAVPSARQIFDFHPAGSAPGTFRQPFIINMNDGPLTADVRQTAAELKAYNEHLKVDMPIAGRKPCSKTGVAVGKAGCVAPPAGAAVVPGHKATAVQ